MNEELLLKMEGISKSFGEVQALREVNFTLNYSEIVGLVGGNGAGKSTLIKILAGVFSPDKGKIYLEGKEISLKSPKDAYEHGIYTVHQKMEEILAPHHDVAANIFMGEELTRPFPGRAVPLLQVLAKKQMEEEAEQIFARVGIKIDSVLRPMISYSGGQRQAVALARALRKRPKILVLDEPTAALGVKEKFQVLHLIRHLGKDENIPIILVSHNLEEVFEIVDRIVVLRNGQMVGECAPCSVTKEHVVKMIVGGE